jgi:hypothetical protein
MYRLDEVRELDLPVSIEFDTNDGSEQNDETSLRPDSRPGDALERSGDDTDRPLEEEFDFGPHASGRKKFDEEDEGGTSGESSDEDAEFEFDDDDEELGDDEDDEDDDAGFDDDEDDDLDDDDDDDDSFDDMDDDD